MEVVVWGGYNKSGNFTNYEITDHLGNVRAVIRKNGSSSTLTLQQYADYYWFGEQLPNRNSFGGYMYAYQGQELDSKTEMEAFKLRLWDGRIGRWLSPDPYGQYHSPYLGMGNNSISMTDLDGGWADGDGGGWWKKLLSYVGLAKDSDSCESLELDSSKVSFNLNEVFVYGNYRAKQDRGEAIPCISCHHNAIMGVAGGFDWDYFARHRSGIQWWGSSTYEFGAKKGKDEVIYFSDQDDNMATPFNGGGTLLIKLLHKLNRMSDFTQGVKETADIVGKSLALYDIYQDSPKVDSVIIRANVDIHNILWINNGVRDTAAVKGFVLIKAKDNLQKDSIINAMKQLSLKAKIEFMNGEIK